MGRKVKNKDLTPRTLVNKERIAHLFAPIRNGQELAPGVEQVLEIADNRGPDLRKSGQTSLHRLAGNLRLVVDEPVQDGGLKVRGLFVGHVTWLPSCGETQRVFLSARTCPARHRHPHTSDLIGLLNVHRAFRQPATGLCVLRVTLCCSAQEASLCGGSRTRVATRCPARRARGFRGNSPP